MKDQDTFQRLPCQRESLLNIGCIEFKKVINDFVLHQIGLRICLRIWEEYAKVRFSNCFRG